MKIRLASILTDSIVDGPGLRTVIFTQGCKHGCLGCHNAQTWSFSGGFETDTAEILNQLLTSSNRNVTFSGGDPFFQAEACAEIASVLRDHGFNLWAYTGFTISALLNSKDVAMHRFLETLDVVVDGLFVLKLKSYSTPYRGSSNQRLIDVQATLSQHTIIDFLPENKEVQPSKSHLFI